MLKIKSEKKSFGINLPTDLREITPDYFKTILENVTVSKNYCVIALCRVDTLFGCINNVKQNLDGRASVNVVMAKPNGLEVSEGDRILIEPSAIERALHLHVPNNVISYGKVAEYCIADDDLFRSIQKGTFFNDGKATGAEQAKLKSPHCWFVDFKIVPFVDIKASYPIDARFDCIYKEVDSTLN